MTCEPLFAICHLLFANEGQVSGVGGGGAAAVPIAAVEGVAAAAGRASIGLAKGAFKRVAAARGCAPAAIHGVPTEVVVPTEGGAAANLGEGSGAGDEQGQGGTRDD